MVPFKLSQRSWLCNTCWSRNRMTEVIFARRLNWVVVQVGEGSQCTPQMWWTVPKLHGASKHFGPFHWTIAFLIISTFSVSFVFEWLIVNWKYFELTKESPRRAYLIFVTLGAPPQIWGLQKYAKICRSAKKYFLKYTQHKKSTPPPVLRVVINISYAEGGLWLFVK